MPSRRDFLELTGAAVAGSMLITSTASANPKVPKTPAIATGDHKVRDLPFQPGKLKGLSAALITSHHQNNYGGAVKNLNAVELELAKITKDTPGYQVAALRERELTFANSVYLHEAYFENLGGNARPTGEFPKALAAQFGSAARWEELVRATAMSLGGGSGWVVIALSQRTSDLRIVGTGGHSQALAAGTPILVLDMFEHAYALDYGAAHAKYIDAFFANLNWANLDKRWQAARACSGKSIR